MAKFKAGDTVSDKHGNVATVLGTMDSVYVAWHGLEGVNGTHPAASFELVPRKFKSGDYARIVGTDPKYDGEVVFILEDDGDPEDDCPYTVVFSRLSLGEEIFSADEMIPWVPKVGERVILINEEDEAGVIIGMDSTVARVQWDDYPVAQYWLVSELEPAFEEDDDEIAVGDSVTYSNPIFVNTANAEVIAVEENIVWVRFEPGVLIPDGAYSKEFFSKAA